MLKKKEAKTSNDNVMYKELNNRLTLNLLIGFFLFGMIGKWMNKTDVRLDKIESDISEDRVRLYHDIEEDYGFMMEDNTALDTLLENAK